MTLHKKNIIDINYLLCNNYWEASFMKKRFLHTKKGFTLIELVAVIAIVAILAAGAVIGLTALLKNNKVKAEKAEVETAFMVCQSIMAEVNGGHSTIVDPATVSLFQNRLNVSKNVKEVGLIKTDFTINTPEGVYINCYKGSSGWVVDKLWYVINNRVWLITGQKTQYTDKDGTVVM